MRLNSDVKKPVYSPVYDATESHLLIVQRVIFTAVAG